MADMSDFEEEMDNVNLILEESSDSELSGFGSDVMDTSGSDTEIEPVAGNIRDTGNVSQQTWSSRIKTVPIYSCNMLAGPCFPRQFDTDTAQPGDYSSLMFDIDMFDRIAAETNKYADLCQKEKGSADKRWQLTGGMTNAAEIKAYFGIAMMMGVNPMPEYSDYWSDDPFLGCDGFKRTLTLNR